MLPGMLVVAVGALLVAWSVWLIVRRKPR